MQDKNRDLKRDLWVDSLRDHSQQNIFCGARSFGLEIFDSDKT